MMLLWIPTGGFGYCILAHVYPFSCPQYSFADLVVGLDVLLVEIGPSTIKSAKKRKQVCRGAIEKQQDSHEGPSAL